MISTRLGALARLAALGLVAGVLPLLVVPPAAEAAAAVCLTEQGTGGFLGIGQKRCDDVTPPQTTVTATEPAGSAPNTAAAKFTFAGSYTDADKGAITFECRFSKSTATPPAWAACSSPATYTGLDPSTGYAFAVRAIDGPDNAIDARTSPGSGGTGAATDAPDVDQTPAAVTFTTGGATPSGGCLSEAPQGGITGGIGQRRCDDVTPPQSVIQTATPAIRGGIVSSTDVKIPFVGTYADADTGTLAYECQVYTGSTAPTSWTACASPASFTGLQDGGTYTFRVRASDDTDAKIDATSSPGTAGVGASSDQPDVDQTPAAVTFTVDTTPDTTPPNVAVDGLPADYYNPTWPMVASDSPTFTLKASESGVTLACTINGRRYACKPGRTTFKNIPAGDATLKIVATDAAGNVDPTPFTTRFSVPKDLAASTSAGWRTVKAAGFVGGDYLQTTKKGARVSTKVTSFRELRLIAPIGPGYGSLVVSLSNGERYLLDLNLPQRDKHAVFVLRDRRAKKTGGTITITSQSTRKLLVDAVLAH